MGHCSSGQQWMAESREEVHGPMQKKEHGMLYLCNYTTGKNSKSRKREWTGNNLI